jgi:hypothetical protein
VIDKAITIEEKFIRLTRHNSPKTWLDDAEKYLNKFISTPELQLEQYPEIKREFGSLVLVFVTRMGDDARFVYKAHERKLSFKTHPSYSYAMGLDATLEILDEEAFADHLLLITTRMLDLKPLPEKLVS